MVATVVVAGCVWEVVVFAIAVDTRGLGNVIDALVIETSGWAVVFSVELVVATGVGPVAEEVVACSVSASVCDIS